MLSGEERDLTQLPKSSVVDLIRNRNSAKSGDTSQSIDPFAKSASIVEAEVDTAMSAIRRAHADGKSLKEELGRHQEQIYDLRQLVAELRAHKEDAHRELSAAAKMLMTEKERATAFEHALRLSEARAKSLEEWNATLKGHLDGLIASIHEGTSADDVVRIQAEA